jgi:hypothetical protein
MNNFRFGLCIVALVSLVYALNPSAALAQEDGPIPRWCDASFQEDGPIPRMFDISFQEDGPIPRMLDTSFQEDGPIPR